MGGRIVNHIETETNVTTDRLVNLARQLRTIEYFSRLGLDDDGDTSTGKTLLALAIAKADDSLMPGGLAMVAMGPVANLEQYSHRLDTAEEEARARAYRLGLNVHDSMPEVIDDDDWEPPLQTLCFWSEAWRTERGMEFEAEEHRPRPTIESESSFLRLSLEWAWDNELHFDDFEEDVRKAKGGLEALLSEGSRAVARGVPCMYDECKGQRLIRTTVAVRDPETEGQTWVLTDWHCPNCERSYSEQQYASNVFAALHRDKSLAVEVLEPASPSGWRTEVWCAPELAAKRVGRPYATVRVWIHRGEVAQLCAIGDDERKEPRRLVRLADVQHRHDLAVQRWERRQAAIAARLANSRLNARRG